MYMRDWIAKLDDFLEVTGRDVLTHAGLVSHQQALEKAQLEYEKFRYARLNESTQVEKHFEEAVDKTRQLSNGRKK